MLDELYEYAYVVPTFSRFTGAHHDDTQSYEIDSLHKRYLRESQRMYLMEHLFCQHNSSTVQSSSSHCHNIRYYHRIIQSSAERPASTMTQEQDGEASSKSQRAFTWIGSLLTVLSVLVYLIPLLYSNNDEAVLDEMHLIDSVRMNQDVHGTSSLSQVLQNDYWGRPIHANSSHKSWRPFSVLLLRYLSNTGEAGFLTWITMKPILLQRIVNVILHTVTAHLVGSLAPKVFPSNNPWIRKTTQWVAFLLFTLHPAHVEVVANVANRPHVLALLCSLLTVHATRIEVIILAWTIGLLSCETMVFQLPAVLLTATIVRWRVESQRDISSLLVEMIPRYVIWIALTAIYLIGRFLWGTLSIPTALLERAEAPFHDLKGMERVVSYSYIVALHIGKSFGIDPLGFAHEYGYACVDPIQSLADFRLLAPLLILAMIASLIFEIKERRSMGFSLVVITALAWMATLFPISGFVKVGTFIADRMVMPSTVVVSVFGGYAAAVRIVNSKSHRLVLVLLLAFFFVGFWTPRVWQRTKDWTDHKLLFDRTRETCPNSAKNLLQLSKVRSGSGGLQHVDWDKSLELVQQAQQADPYFCRVHFQFAHIYLKQERYRDVEYHLTRAVDCPTSASQALDLWNKYWNAQVDQDAGRKRREKLLKAYEKGKKDTESALKMEAYKKRGQKRNEL